MTRSGITAGYLTVLCCILLKQKILLQPAGKGCAKGARLAGDIACNYAPGP